MSRIMAWLAGIFAAASAILFALLKGEKAKSAEQRADIAQADASAGRKTDAAIAAVQAKHRQEQQDSEARFKAGQRDHLEGKW